MQPPAITSEDAAAAPLDLGPTARAALEDALDAESEAVRVRNLPVTECMYVTSEAGRWPKVAPCGLIGASSSWSSACGWKFAGCTVSLATKLPERLCHKMLCAKCFVELRAKLKG